MKRVGPKSWAPLPKKQRASSAQVRAARPAGMAAGAGIRRSGPGSARLGSEELCDPQNVKNYYRNYVIMVP